MGYSFIRLSTFFVLPFFHSYSYHFPIPFNRRLNIVNFDKDFSRATQYFHGAII